MKEFFSKQTWNVIRPHLIVVALFVILSAAYFSPVLKGKVLPQMDNIHAEGAAHELSEYEAASGTLSQWTGSMFGGMPAYQVKSDTTHNVFYHLSHIIRFGLPYTTIAILFLYLLGFYILLLSLKANPWVAAVGAIAFALGSYNIIIIAAGHITKCYAIAMMPLVVGGMVMLFNGRRFVGSIFFMVALGLELAFNHVQITYYLALALGLYYLIEFGFALKKKTMADFGKNTAWLAVACLLAVLPGTTNLATTYEYGAYSIRGASELKASDNAPQHDGLDKEYALSWSYGIHETPTLLIPNVVGGASELIGNDAKALRSLDPQIRAAVAQQSKYWGGRSFTSGPVYVGAIICFLFFIGCFFYDGRLKWWLIGVTILSIVLAWGKNFPLLTDFMFYHFPLYNKFRTVEMALVIATVSMPLLAMLGLKSIYDTPELIKYRTGKFFAAIGLSAGVALLIAAFPSLFYDFVTPQESQMLGELRQQNAAYGLLEDGLREARMELCITDAIRTIVFIILASSALWFCSVGRLGAKVMVATVGVLVLIDMWSVDRRYLSSDKFVNKTENRNFALSAADKIILEDKNPHRVMALYTNPFNEVFTSYYHRSVGGYHGAKLRRYQDVIDRYLMSEWQQLVSALQSQDYDAMESTLENATALNMLNTRYLIYNPQQKPLYNKNVLTEGWFVDNARTAADADEALSLLGKTNLGTTAIIEDAEVGSFSVDSNAVVSQTEYAPDHVVYETHSESDGLAVFSEVYYPAGWKAFIDGEETEILRADYILRALRIPAGEHKVEFVFKPASFVIGNIVSTAASAVVVIILAASFVLAVRKRKGLEETNNA